MKKAAGIAASGILLCITGCGGDSPTGPSGPPAPQVYSITPAHGPAAGGTSVRIGGANFALGVLVTIGGVAATDVVVESSASITARTAARAPGAGDVVVSSGGKTAVLPSGFTYDSGQPPVISDVSARGARTNEPASFADLGETLTITATAQDPDTPADQLKFEWSSDAGAFVGAGAAVQWQAPATATTPGQVILNVAVSDGVSRVTGSVTVRLHDTVKEVGDKARNFLLAFSDSNIRDANVVLQDFSQGPRCISGRDDEKADVEKNRNLYKIESFSIGSASVNVAFGGKPCSYLPENGDACASVPAVWNWLCLQDSVECKKGESGRSSGLDFVTAVYEDSKWLLCDSHWKPDATTRPGFMR